MCILPCTGMHGRVTQWVGDRAETVQAHMMGGMNSTMAAAALPLVQPEASSPRPDTSYRSWALPVSPLPGLPLCCLRRRHGHVGCGGSSPDAACRACSAQPWLLNACARRPHCCHRHCRPPGRRHRRSCPRRCCPRDGGGHGRLHGRRRRGRGSLAVAVRKSRRSSHLPQRRQPRLRLHAAGAAAWIPPTQPRPACTRCRSCLSTYSRPG